MSKLPNGFMLIDKPAGMTSHDVVDFVRREIKSPKPKIRLPKIRPLTSSLRPPKVGHAGTLDPFATGLLIVGVGREATKRLDEFKALPKTYEVVAELGATSSTGDVDGKITKTQKHEIKKAKEEIKKAIQKFLGEQEQIPPMYSAKKVGGQKLYKLARAGKTIKRKPQKITVYKIEILEYLEYNGKELKLRVKCSAGVYIRTLVEDIGEALGVGAYCKELRRTRIGKYSVKDATKMSNFKAQITNQ